jgi:hypothetical protein
MTSPNNAWCIAAESGGSVHVVWQDKRNPPEYNTEIFYKRSTDFGANWGQDICLSNEQSGSYTPSICVLESLVHVVWEDIRYGGMAGIYYIRSTDKGVTWSSPYRLSDLQGGSYYPSAATNGLDVHVVWHQQVGLHSDIFYRRSTDGGTSWFNITQLTIDTSGSGYPSIAVSGSNVHIAFYDDRDGNGEIYFKRSTDRGSTWSPDTRLTFAPDWSWWSSVGATDSVVNIVWQDHRYGSWDFYYKRSTDNGVSWSPDNLFASGVSWPSIFVSGAMVHVIWSAEQIYYRRSSDFGANWSPAIRLTDSRWGGWYPSISAAGRAVHIVWTDSQDGNYEIYYKRNPTGNSGVEESSGSFYPLTSNLSFSVFPNPFTSFATLPGHEAERFALYDISGRRVGVYRGDRIGTGLSAGVYFLRPQGGNAKPVRVVKVR